MAKRRQRGPTDQRRLTLPLVLWEQLEAFCELQSDAYEAMGGKTTFTVSDLVESAAAIYLRDVAADVGQVPDEKAAKSTRDAFVKRLADRTRKQLIADLYQAPPQIDD